MQPFSFIPFPELTTERLILRQLQIEDEYAVYRIRSDEELNRFLDRQKALSIEDAREFIKKINSLISSNQSIYWAITLKDNPALIGTICFWNISWEHEIAEIGYELLPDHQGKGFMQEAILKVIDFGFDKMHLKTIDAYPSSDNINSVKILEKNKFKIDRSVTGRNIHSEDLKNIEIYALYNGNKVRYQGS